MAKIATVNSSSLFIGLILGLFISTIIVLIVEANQSPVTAWNIYLEAREDEFVRHQEAIGAKL